MSFVSSSMQGKDAQVPARHVVIVVGQRPADSLRQPRRDRDRGDSAWPQHPGYLADRALVVRNVLEYLGRDDDVEPVVRERHHGRVAGRGRNRRRALQLACLGHGGRDRRYLLQLAVISVQRDDLGAAPRGLKRVPAGAAPEVEEPRSRLDGQSCEVNGQHGAASPACRAAGARLAAIARRYSATVALATAGHAKRSATRASAAADSRSRSAGESCSVRSAAHSSSGVAGRHQHRRVAGHLGQRAGAAGHQRGAGRHVLDCGKREALVQGRHDGDLGAGDKLGQLGVADAADELHLVGQ